jgi:hypothetical protein
LDFNLLGYFPQIVGPIFSQRVSRYNLPVNLPGNEFSISTGKLRLHEYGLNIIFPGVFN